MTDARILVLSCAWSPFRSMAAPWWIMFERYWPDCPYPVTWAECPTRERSWGDFAAEAARGCAESEIIVWMDDFILCAPTDTAEVARCLAEMRERKAVYYRLQPTPECTDPFDHGKGGVHRRGEPYRASLHIAAWNRDHFADRSAKFGDPWSFETEANRYGDYEYLAVTRPNRPLSHVEGLKRRRLTEDGRRILTELGLPIPAEGAC